MPNRRKAVSSVISTVLMTTLALTMGILVFFWASQTFGVQVGNAGVYFQNSSNSLLEGIVIEDVWFNVTSNQATVWVTVRNVGTINVNLVAIYLNSTSQTNTYVNGVFTSITNGISLGVGNSVSIEVTTTHPNWNSYTVAYISVATARGTVVTEYYATSN